MTRSLGRYGKWSLVCKGVVSSISDCGLVQAVRSDANDDRLSVALTLDQDQHVDARIMIEPPPVHTEGVALLIDGVQDEVLTPTDCDAKGCSGTWIISTTSLGKLFAGTKLDAQFRVRPEHGSSLAVDLNNLSEGLIAMQNAMPPQISSDIWSRQLVKNNDWSFSAEIVKWTMGTGSFFEALDPAHPVTCYSADMKPGILSSTIRVKLNVGQDLTAQPVSLDETKELTEAAQACGNKVAVVVKSTDQGALDEHSSYLMQIKKSAVEAYLQKLGVGKGQLIVTGDGNQGFFGGQKIEDYGSWGVPVRKP